MPGKTWYRDWTFSGELDDLGRMADRYRETLATIHARREERQRLADEGGSNV